MPGGSFIRGGRGKDYEKAETPAQKSEIAIMAYYNNRISLKRVIELCKANGMDQSDLKKRLYEAGRHNEDTINRALGLPKRGRLPGGQMT